MWLDQRGTSECTQTNFTPMYITEEAAKVMSKRKIYFLFF